MTKKSRWGFMEDGKIEIGVQMREPLVQKTFVTRNPVLLMLLSVCFSLSGCSDENTAAEPKLLGSERVESYQDMAMKYATEKMKIASLTSESHWVKWLYKDDGTNRQIEFSFYDKSMFKEKSELTAMLGGCPAYFTVTVSLSEDKVVDEYCSSM